MSTLQKILFIWYNTYIASYIVYPYFVSEKKNTDT